MDVTYKPKELKPVKNGKEMDTIFLDKEFERKILLHIVSNSLQKNLASCFLAIEGKMGEGKTVQTINTCFKHNIHVYYFSSSQLAGNLERDSIKELEATYNYLVEHNEDNIFNVIIIDDFHLSIASCEANVSRTVNSQILTDYLMSIADTTKASPGKKIPFILIANTFENLYSPLTRDGRMNLFKWEPSNSQKKELICKMFRDILKDGITQQFENLVKEYIDESMSFFGEIKNDIYIKEIEKCLKDENFADLSELVNKLNEDIRIYNKKFVEVNQVREFIVQRKKNYQIKKGKEVGISNLNSEEVS